MIFLQNESEMRQERKCIEEGLSTLSAWEMVRQIWHELPFIEGINRQSNADHGLHPKLDDRFRKISPSYGRLMEPSINHHFQPFK